MKKTTPRFTIALILMAMMTFATGCNKPDDLTVDEPINVVNINPEYVPIDWGTTTMASYNDNTGDYQIQFADGVPDIHPGSIITIDRDTVALYRFVTAVNMSGNTVVVQTIEASLTDIFYDTDITLSTSRRSAKSSRGNAAFYPVEAYVMEEDGKYRRLNCGESEKSDTRFTHNLWKYEYNNDNQVLFSGSNYSVKMEKMNLDLSLDLEMRVNFGGKTEKEVVNEAIDRYRSKALKLGAYLVGTFNTEQRVRCDVNGSCSYDPDYDIWKHNLFPPVNVKFLVSGVPIVLKLRSDLFRQVELSSSGELSAYTGFSNRTEGRLGFEWQQTGEMTPVATFENTFQFIPPTLEGKGQVQAKVWAFPRVSVMFYDAIGPSFDIMPYMADTVRGGFREQMLGQSNDYCAWNLDCHAGVDVRYGMSRRFFGYEVDNYSTPRQNLFDKKLYHSPKKVVHSSGRPHEWQTATVRFVVYDQNYLLNQEVKTPLPQIVKFEASGNLSREYGIASNGVVTVDWTPTDDDILYATLYDQEGNVIAWDSVQVGSPMAEWVDLGLPSGLLWRSCNLGATSPEEYGDYYAWGETATKSTYDLSTYQYGNDWDQLTKYCNDSDYGYNGFTDNLTTLLPEDDAATQVLGSGARIPTQAEWQELINNTNSEWTTMNGVNGRRFTASNGNSLFLPAAGYRDGGSLSGAGSYGYYWSASLHESYPHYAWNFYFSSGYQLMGYYNRYNGLSVRAVRASEN